MAQSITGLMLTDAQVAVLERMIPMGILRQQILYGPTERETRNIKDTYRILRESGVTDQHIYNYRGRIGMLRRDLLTQDGIALIIERVLPPHIAAGLACTAKISIRHGINADDLRRMIRIADTQTFLMSCDVQNPYTLIKSGVDPFIFGRPDSKLPGSRVNVRLVDVLHDAMVYAVCHAEQAGRPYPQPDSGCGALYIPLSMIPGASAPAATTSGRMPRTSNSAMGVLVDLANRCAYAIYHDIPGMEVTWNPKSCGAMKARLVSGLRRLRIANVDQTHYWLKDAIILCDTERDLRNKLVRCERMRDPYSRLIPIRTNQAGVNMLQTILRDGINDYMLAACNDALSRLPLQMDCKIAINALNEPVIRCGNDVLHHGLVLDLAKTAGIKYRLDRGLMGRIVCYDWQVSLYETAGIDRKNLIVIDT